MKRYYGLVTVIVWAVTGCAGKGSLPAIASTGTDSHLVGKFVWRDLLTEDQEAAERFYGGLFGWTFRPTETSDYTLIVHQDRPIAGVVRAGQETREINESQWVSLLSVGDVDEAVRQVRGVRGQIHVGPLDLPERGRLAVASDAEGALLAFIRTRNGDPPDREPDMGDWLWTELWAGDVERAAGFYQALVGYRSETTGTARDYRILRSGSGDVPRAGILEKPLVDIRSHWLPYVRVENARGIADRVPSLGGRVVVSPQSDLRNGTVAIIMDPSGAVLAVQQWPI